MTFEEFKSRAPINAIPLHEQVRQFYAEQARRCGHVGGGQGVGCPGGIRLTTGNNSPTQLYVYTSTGYVTYSAGGLPVTLGSGNPADQLGPIEVSSDGGFCVFPGQIGSLGDALSLFDSSANITSIDLSSTPALTLLDIVSPALTAPPQFSLLPLLQTLGLQEWPFQTIDLSALSQLSSFASQFSALTALDFSANPLVSYVYCPGCAIVDVDATINSLNPANPNGSVDLSGGTSAPRTAASDANYNALLLNGWTIITN